MSNYLEINDHKYNPEGGTVISTSYRKLPELIEDISSGRCEVYDVDSIQLKYCEEEPCTYLNARVIVIGDYQSKDILTQEQKDRIDNLPSNRQRRDK